MPEFELELDDNHIYRLNGTSIPGCTQILAAIGATPGFNFLTPTELEFYRSRGHAVHKAIELHIKGTLDKRTIVDEVNPYLIGWDRFAEEHEFMPFVWNGELVIERPIHHDLFTYGVTPDVLGEVDGVSAVIEVKATSAHAPATGLQLAAQLDAAVRTYGYPASSHRIGLRLMPEAPYYDMRYYTERSDRSTWMSMVSTYHWLKSHKLLREIP